MSDRRPAVEMALLEIQLESVSLYDDLDRIEAEHEITQSVIAELDLKPERFLLLACGPSSHHTVRFNARHPQAHGVAVDISLPFVSMARASSAGASFAVGDMRALGFVTAAFDLLGMYGNSFGFFDHDANLEVLRELARCLRPGGAAVITVPRFDYIAGFTESSPLRWDETAESSLGRLHMRGERYYDPRRGLSIGRYEQHNLTTGERFVRTNIPSLVYSFEPQGPAQPGLSRMAAECGFSKARLVPIPSERTRNANGLMSRMDCLVLTR